MKPSFEDVSRSDEEIREYFRILKNNPRSRIFASLAEALVGNEKIKEAETVCKMGLEANPDFTDGHLTYARVLLRLNRHPEALEQIDITLGLNPNRIEAYLVRAEIYLAGNQIEAASQTCIQALDIDPTNSHLQDILQRLGARERLNDPRIKEKEPARSFQATAGTLPKRRTNDWEASRYVAKQFHQLMDKAEPDDADKIEQEQPFAALSPGSHPIDLAIQEIPTTPEQSAPEFPPYPALAQDHEIEEPLFPKRPPAHAQVPAPDFPEGRSAEWVQSIIDKYSGRGSPGDEPSILSFRMFHIRKILTLLYILLILGGLGALVTVGIRWEISRVANPPSQAPEPVTTPTGIDPNPPLTPENQNPPVPPDSKMGPDAVNPDILTPVDSQDVPTAEPNNSAVAPESQPQPALSNQKKPSKEKPGKRNQKKKRKRGRRN